MSTQSRIMGIATAVEAGTVRALLALPVALRRRIAGPPVVQDGQTLALETQLLLRLQQLARRPDIGSLPVEAGRRAIGRETGLTGGRLPIGSVRDLRVGDLPGRLYTPSGAAARPTGLLVFLHGGGFVHGDLESHDAPCRFLAERAGVRVLAVDYRLAPEHPFPAAYDDAVASLGWAFEHAAELGADPQRIAVGGDSAGANLATGAAIEAARRGWPLRWQLLVYPTTDAGRDTRSFSMFAEGFFLTAGYMRLATESYLPGGVDARDPRVSPLYAELPADLAPAYVVTAGFDPLRDEGEQYAQALTAAGVETELQRFPDQIHGFFNMVGLGTSGPAANAEIARRLRTAIGG